MEAKDDRQKASPDNKRLNKRLTLRAWGVALVGVALLCLGETDCLPTGVLVTGTKTSYALEIMECALLLVCVPLALKLMSLRSVRRSLQSCPSRYLPLATLRIALLALPLLMGLLLYFFMVDTSMLYCALIAAVAFLYIWPSESRLGKELKGEGEA